MINEKSSVDLNRVCNVGVTSIRDLKDVVLSTNQSGYKLLHRRGSMSSIHLDLNIGKCPHPDPHGLHWKTHFSVLHGLPACLCLSQKTERRPWECLQPTPLMYLPSTPWQASNGLARSRSPSPHSSGRSKLHNTIYLEPTNAETSRNCGSVPPVAAGDGGMRDADRSRRHRDNPAAAPSRSPRRGRAGRKCRTSNNPLCLYFSFISCSLPLQSIHNGGGNRWACSVKRRCLPKSSVSESWKEDK